VTNLKWLVALVLLFAIAPPALANPDKPNTPIEKMTDAQRRQYARIWFERGRDQFERLRHYDEAIASFSESYRYDPRPLILFDIGNVARVAGMNDVAADYFARYLKAAGPLEPEVAEARHWYNKLSGAGSRDPRDERAAAGQPTGDAPATAPPPAATPAGGTNAVAVAPVPVPAPAARDDAGSGRTKFITGLVVGGAGVVIAATGIGLLAHSGSISNQLVDQSHEGQFDRGLYDQGSHEQVAGAVLIGVGAAAAVAGTVVAILGVRQKHRVQTQARLGAGTIGLGGSGLALGW
jgi:hypothetical protein